MERDEKLKEAIVEHTTATRALTDYLGKLTKYLENDLEKYRKELEKYSKRVEDKRAEAYRNLVLALGYSIYFATWVQLKDIFCKTPILWSYGLMVISLFISVSTLIYMHIKLLYNKKNEKSEEKKEQTEEKSSICTYYVDIAAVVFGVLSLLMLLFSAICYLCTLMK